MKTIKHVLLTGLVFLFILNGYSQDRGKNGERRERIDSAKISFLIQRLNLTPAQSEKFWPVYNEYREKKKDLRQQQGTLRSQEGNLTATDEQIKKDLEKLMELRQKDVDVEKEYYQKFQKVISIRQIAELYRSEKQFARELITDLRGGRRRH